MARHPSVTANAGRAPGRVHPRVGRWRAILGQSLPVLGVSLVVLIVGVIAYYVYTANRHGAAALSNDLVNAIEQRIVVQMRAYLEPAQRLLELADTAVEGRPVLVARREAERYARHALVAVPAVSAVSYADAEGDYLLVLRNDKGSFDTKLVDLHGGSRRVTWVRRDRNGAVTSTADDPTDTFDARERPWFKAATEARRPVWTDTYQFFTIRKPGLTFAIPRYNTEGDLLTVMALDIELASLSTFLSRLAIGITGKAYIIDRNGRIVAFPSENWSLGEGGRAPRLDELGDPTLTRAYNRLRVEGYGRKVLDFGERRIIVSSEPLSMLAGRDWVALIVVPETDFVGFVANSGWFALGMSAVVLAIVIGLAALLTWRNVVAARRVAAATTRQQALEGRTRAFVDLARTIATEDEAEGVAQTSESAAATCAAKRVAIWRLSGDRNTLSCEDCYDATARAHTSGLALHRDELPDLFAALDNGAVIDATDARRDRRTAEFHASYLEPLAIDNVYLSPLLYNGRAIGLLSVEDPQRGDKAAGLASFCETLSILLALRFSAAAPALKTLSAATQPAPLPAGEATPSALEIRQTRLERVLIHHNLSLKVLGAGALDGAAVGVLKLPDWMTVAQRPPDGGGHTAMETIVQEVRSVVERSGVGYAALLDDQIILAAFPGDDAVPERGAALVATAMLELRDCLTRLEEKWGTSLDFRLAIDVGTVMTSALGPDPGSRNLWGGAVGVAKVLAATTARHTIASSETAYELLSGTFLFRARGSYFLPETGTMRTFVMIGRT